MFADEFGAIGSMLDFMFEQVAHFGALQLLSLFVERRRHLQSWKNKIEFIELTRRFDYAIISN